MAKASVSELKANLAKYLRAAQRGDEVQILQRGVLIARLTGAADLPGEARADRLVEAGVLRPRRSSTRALLASAAPLELPGIDLSSALQDERGDRI